MRFTSLSVAGAFSRLWFVTGMPQAASASASASESASASASMSASVTDSTFPAAPTIYNASTLPDTPQYAYAGCVLEISGLNGTAGSRSLQGRTTSEVRPGDMTVPKCLAFCGGGSSGGSGSGTAYTYAGLEYARECWCGSALAGLAAARPEAECALPCDGDTTTVCGGNLRISVRHATI